MSAKILFGFHAVTVRLKTAPESVVEIHVDASRRDARMRTFVERVKAAGAKLVDSDDDRLIRLAGSPRHQGVVARVNALGQRELARRRARRRRRPGLGAGARRRDRSAQPGRLPAGGRRCRRACRGRTKDHAVGLNATVAKVASGAAETVPYLMVTNLARTLGE